MGRACNKYRRDKQYINKIKVEKSEEKRRLERT